MGEKFGLGILIKRMLENCFLDVAEGGWEVGGEELSRKVCLYLLTQSISGYSLTLAS